MLTEELYQSRIAALRRALFRKRVMKIALDGLYYFSLACVPVLVLQKLALFSFKGYPAYAFLLGLAVLLSLLQHMYRMRSFRRELIAIDIRLDLKERLSTAHEYHQKPEASQLEKLLKQEAVDLLADLRKQTILPVVWGRRHIGLAAAAILLAILPFIDLKPLVWSSADQNKENLELIGLKISQYVRQQPNDKKRPEPDTHAIPQQLQDLAREIEKKTVHTEKVREAVQRMLSDVEQEQSKILERLQSELNERVTEDAQASAAVSTGRGTAGIMDQLVKKIHEKYGDQIPGALSKDIVALDQNRRLEDFLNETAQNLKSISGNGGKPGGKSKTEKGVVAGDRETNQTEDEAKPRSRLPEVQGSKNAGNKPLKGDLPGQGIDPKEGRSGEGRPGKEPAALAGRGKGSDEKKEPYTLPVSKGNIFKDQGIAGPAESYNANVRSLTKITRTTATESQILRTYQQELEETLLKEEIPVSYRNYIKKYFLNIGLRKEEKENDSDQ